MEDMLRKLEEEEKDEKSEDEEENTATATAAAASSSDVASTAVPADEETRVVLRTRTPSPPPSPEDSTKSKTLPEIVSAARPPPVKSALKASACDRISCSAHRSVLQAFDTAFSTSTLPAPGAIKSSYSWEDLEKDQPKPKQPAFAEAERQSRSHTPTSLSRNSSLLGRVMDGNSSPVTSGTSTPTKKSVRIKSPERAHPEVKEGSGSGSGLTPLQRMLSLVSG